MKVYFFNYIQWIVHTCTCTSTYMYVLIACTTTIVVVGMHVYCTWTSFFFEKILVPGSTVSDISDIYTKCAPQKRLAVLKYYRRKRRKSQVLPAVESWNLILSILYLFPNLFPEVWGPREPEPTFVQHLPLPGKASTKLNTAMITQKKKLKKTIAAKTLNELWSRPPCNLYKIFILFQTCMASINTCRDDTRKIQMQSVVLWISSDQNSL